MAKRKKKRPNPTDDAWEGFFEAAENQDWINHVRDELVPMIRKTQMTISLIPENLDKVDLKFAVELGLSVMMDKPIIAVITPGMQVPGQLLRLADHIIEWDGEPTEASKAALFAAIEEVGGGQEEE